LLPSAETTIDPDVGGGLIRQKWSSDVAEPRVVTGFLNLYPTEMVFSVFFLYSSSYIL
jgi:hypothetical protein